jgi:NADPH-dependent 2,4-dienoyl-CoA reductase/sulfur reductase-like enzyme
MHHGKSLEIPCDYLACGFHLVPSLELAQLLGCKTFDGFVATDDFQQTSVPNVYCAGEPTGIGGVELSLVEGQIAAFSASGQRTNATRLFRQRAAARKNMRSIAKAFPLRDELKSIPLDDTLVCRCEDVPFSKLRDATSWRSAKLHTRCGMGPCQGRVCGAATEFLFAWNVGEPRPPLFPVQCSSLTRAYSEPDLQNSQGASQ